MQLALVIGCLLVLSILMFLLAGLCSSYLATLRKQHTESIEYLRRLHERDIDAVNSAWEQAGKQAAGQVRELGRMMGMVGPETPTVMVEPMQTGVEPDWMHWGEGDRDTPDPTDLTLPDEELKGWAGVMDNAGRAVMREPGEEIPGG
jgi:hypothetical protein